MVAAVKSAGSLRILVVEDSQMNRLFAVRLLESQGHSVTVAHNGREAVERTGREGFDVVLMDVEMPEMDGIAATRAIRAREAAAGGRLPIVAVTSSGDVGQCLAAGMDAYLEKPLSVDSLRRTLRSLLAA